jgi:tape measure domain-containing protein
LRIVTDTQEEFVSLSNALFAVSQETRTDFLNNAKIFARLSLATEQLGTSQSDLLEVTSTLNKAILLSGATAQEANAGIIQFTQGLASNRFQGDELRSVLENLVVVGDELAKSLDTDIAGIRALGEAGLLTRDVLVQALLDATERVDARFQELPVTLGQAATRVRNAFIFAFQGDETQPLIEALNELTLELGKPETRQALSQLASAVATVAAGFVRIAPTIATFVTNLKTLGQVWGIVLGGIVETALEFTARGGIFGLIFETNREQLAANVQRIKTAVDLLFDDILEAQKRANDAVINESILNAERRNAIEGQVTELTKKQITIRNRALRQEIRETTTEIRKGAKEIEKLQKELKALDAPTRSTDEFIAQTERFAELRRAEALTREGRLREANEILRTLREEAAELDDVIQKTFLTNRATTLLRENDKALIEQIKTRNAELEREKQLRQDIIDEKPLEDVAPIIVTPEGIAVITKTTEEAEELQNEFNKVAQEGEFAGRTVSQSMASLGLEVNKTTKEVNELSAAFSRLRAQQVAGVAIAGSDVPGGLATGGLIPGFGGGDKVPARLEKGEFVVNKRATRRFLPLIAAMNRGARDLSGFFPLRRMQEGGMIPGDVTSSLLSAATVTGTGSQQTSQETVVLDVRSNGAPLARVRGTRENVLNLTEYLRGFKNNIAGR